MLNVEEMNLVTLFDTSSRQHAIEGVSYALKATQDKELLEILEQLEQKLKQLSDEEFNSIDFKAYMEDEAYGEE